MAQINNCDLYEELALDFQTRMQPLIEYKPGKAAAEEAKLKGKGTAAASKAKAAAGKGGQSGGGGDDEDDGDLQAFLEDSEDSADEEEAALEAQRAALLAAGNLTGQRALSLKLALVSLFSLVCLFSFPRLCFNPTSLCLLAR